MKTKLAIYLAGSIKKDNEKGNTYYWSDSDMTFLKNSLLDCELSFLNPAFRSDDLSDPFSVFGRDMTQVYCCDVVFVDARERRGLGVGAEMMWAKINRIPVITLAPTDSHYNKSKVNILDTSVENWVHPFVECLSDALVENLSEGAMWIKKYVNKETAPIKTGASIHAAMNYYRIAQLPSDEPMINLIDANEDLQQRILTTNKGNCYTRRGLKL